MDQRSRYLTREDTQMTNKHMKRCTTSYVLGEMQIKTMRYHDTPIRMDRIQNTDIAKCWRGCKATRTLITAGGNAKWCSHFEGPFSAFLQN